MKGGARRIIVNMPDWLEFLLFVGAYFAVMRWVLPRFGVGT